MEFKDINQTHKQMGCFNSAIGEQPIQNKPIPKGPYAETPFTITKKIYFLQESCENLIQFDLQTLVGTKTRINWGELDEVNGNSQITPKIFPFFKQIQMRDKLYICGGGTKERGFSKSCFTLNIDSLNLTNLSPMKENRANMGICPINENEFIVAGGNNNIYLNTCEKYNTHGNIWTRMANLNEAKSALSLTIMDTRYIYSIGGCSINNSTDSEESVSSIERIDINKLKPHWVLIPLYQSTWKGCMESACFPINDREIMIFGGAFDDGLDSIPVKDSFLLDTKAFKINKYDKRPPCQELFPHSPFFLQGGVVAIFALTLNLYFYNLGEKAWNVIKEISW